MAFCVLVQINISRRNIVNRSQRQETNFCTGAGCPVLATRLRWSWPHKTYGSLGTRDVKSGQRHPCNFFICCAVVLVLNAFVFLFLLVFCIFVFCFKRSIWNCWTLNSLPLLLLLLRLLLLFILPFSATYGFFSCFIFDFSPPS